MEDAFSKIGNEIKISTFKDADSINKTELFSKELEELDSMARVEGVPSWPTGHFPLAKDFGSGRCAASHQKQQPRMKR